MRSEQIQIANSKEQGAKQDTMILTLLPATCSLLSALCYLLFVILLSSCDKNTGDFSPSPVAEVEQSDKELEKIADNARRALPTFFRNLARPEAGADNFFVKYPLNADDGDTEQVWLGDIRVKDGIYYGRIANTPSLPSDRKKNKLITFDPDKITDWMYIQNRTIIGGRSIKYLLEKIPESQHSEDQKKILLMFDP
jgi:uncharacterized protein YegJ (DUF2314 family)